MERLESRVQQLKQVVVQNNGRNVADAGFVRHLDSLISLFYDDIGEIRNIALKSLFDLFLLKCLYVNRRSTDAGLLDYLAEMLNRFLWSRELLPVGAPGTGYADLLLGLLAETKERGPFQNLFEAYRKLADNSLFITGVLPRSLGRARRAGWRRRSTALPLVNGSYYIYLGKRYYRLASGHQLAEWTGQRAMLAKLSEYFEAYADALSEMSERYVMGFDMDLIADKMLDNFNQYRRTGAPRFLDNARKYAAILKIDRTSFPSLFRRRPRFARLN